MSEIDSRIERILNGETVAPLSRVEAILQGEDIEPQSIIEAMLKNQIGQVQSSAQNIEFATDNEIKSIINNILGG